MDDLWAFLLLTVALSVSPGPDDVLVVSSSLRGGPRLGAATAFGAATGAMVWGAAAAIGLAAVVTRSPTVYDVLRMAGAGYLVVLGAAPLVAQVIRRGRVAVPAAHRTAPGAGLRPAFAAGLMSDLLNPKIGLFYVAIVPQFVPPGRSPFAYSLVLCAIDIAVALVWLLALTWVAHTAVGWLHRPVVVRWSERCFCVCLIAIGGSLALGS